MTTGGSKVDLTVIIAAFDGAALIGAQLDAVLAQEGAGSYEVVVADNGSSDHTTVVVEAYERRDRRVRQIDASRKRGQCFARNQGAAATAAALLVFVDQDDIVRPGYLAAMRAALRDHELVAARLEVDTLNPAWAATSRRPAQVESLGSGLGFLPYAGGQTLGIRHELFDAIGGFDPTMPGAAEDVDLCWRAQLAGASLTYAPDAVVQYRYRTSLLAQARQAFAYGDAQVALYQRYSPRGMERRRLVEVARGWLSIGKRLVLARDRGAVARVVWLAAHGAGMVVASARRRVLYL